MRRVKLLSSAAMLLATGVLVACGGGGGSPGGGIVTPPVVPPVIPPVTPPAPPPPSTTLTTYPSFARILTAAAGATATFHRNSLDTPGGGNHERVEVTSNGTGRSSQTVAIATDDGALSVARTFTPANYQGPTGPTYVYWPSNDIAPTQRPMQLVGWSGGLLALPLYKHVNGAWTQATLAQAFEYGQTDITPGVNSSLFMVSGPRNGTFTGSARFLGDAFGSYQGPFATPAVRVRGEMRMEVDFGRSEIRGALTGLFRSPTLGENVGLQLGLGDIAFSAPLSSSFVATTTPDRGNLTSLAGTVSGEFFGDVGGSSTEVGGVFALQSTQGAFSGAYIAGRNPLPAGIASTITPQTFDGSGGTFIQAVGPATARILRWTRSGPGAGQSTATVAYTRDGVDHTLDVSSLIRNEDTLRFSSGAGVLLEIVERVSGVDLNYSGLGRWRQNLDSATPTPNFFAFGQKTTDMPTTGTASYVGVGYGDYIASRENNLATGRFTLGANFGTGAVNGALENSQARYALSFTGSIAASGLSGTFTTGDGAFSGDVKGFFAGPGAAEVAGTFTSVGAPSGTSYNGGFVATK